MSECYKTAVGNMFSLALEGEVVCVTTNGIVKRDGCAIMGVGTAQIARDSFKGIDKKLGEYLNQYGNRCFNLGLHNYRGKHLRIVTFPTKYNPNDNSDMDLIRKSVLEIKEMADKFNWSKVYIPLPGVGAGKLLWSNVKPLFECLDERFILISIKASDFNH